MLKANTLLTGQYRYYDGLLMMLGLLQISGNLRGRLNDEILKQWKDETKESFWLRGNPSLFDVLGCAK